MILLINTEVSNIGSWQRILKEKKIKFILSDQLSKIKLHQIKKIIFPGVGNFGKVMNNLRLKKLDKLLLELINNKNIQYLGVCAGMQILLNQSEESETSGMGLIKGKIKKLNFPNFTKTHNGWNNNRIIKTNNLVSNLLEKEDFYFNHSYYCMLENQNNIIAHLDGYNDVSTIIHKDNLYGVQFHPEKSHDAGIKILDNFLKI